MGFETPKNLSPEQHKSIEDRRNNNKAFFEALERGGGNVEVQEAKLKLKDLNDKLEMFKKSDPNDRETIEYYEKEIELNQRVANGESLVKVLDSMQSDEDRKRIAIEREKIKNKKQL